MTGRRPGKGTALVRLGIGVAFVAAGVVLGLLLTRVLAPGGVAGRLPGAAEGAARPIAAKTVIVAALLAAGLVLHRIRRDRLAWALVLAAGLAAALHWPPALAPAPVAAPAPPPAPAALPAASAPPAPVTAPAPLPAAPVAPAPPEAAADPPPAGPAFPAPEGCVLFPAPAAGTPDMTATCGFTAGNGDTRLLELRRRSVPAQPASDAAAALLAADAPQPVVVQMSGFRVLSYQARMMARDGRPQAFDLCLRADELREEPGAGARQWSERRYLCRGRAKAADGSATELALILREGHAPDARAPDFDPLAEGLLAALPMLLATEGR